MKMKPAVTCFLALFLLGYSACKNKHKKQKKEDSQETDRFINAPLKGVDVPQDDSLPTKEGDSLSTLVALSRMLATPG